MKDKARTHVLSDTCGRKTGHLCTAWVLVVQTQGFPFSLLSRVLGLVLVQSKNLQEVFRDLFLPI